MYFYVSCSHTELSNMNSTTFLYFGYGSNLNLISLAAKGVVPISSEKGVLKEWSLRFNVAHWFAHEGGMGNIILTNDPKDYVEGIVHTCKIEELPSLDAMEAYGIGYDRIEVEVETQHGKVLAFAYVGLPAFIDDTRLPTKRYLNILLKGAIMAELSPGYIHKLENTELLKMDEYGIFKAPEGDYPTYTVASLKERTDLTSLAGAVFDMSNCRKELSSFKQYFGGKDLTIYHIRRHDTSNGVETISDFLNGRISIGQKEYINAYLNEYAKEFHYSGTIHYEKSL